MKRSITIIFLFLLILISVKARAHIYTLQYSPEPGSSLTTPPDRVTITFVGSVEPAFSKIEVYNERGKKVSGRTIFREDDTIMETKLKKNLPPGKYTVNLPDQRSGRFTQFK